MARAREVDGLVAGEAFAVAAGRIVSVRAHELFDHADDVLDTDDIERVHAMRVASRRLRAVLEIFERAFPAERWRPVLEEVKALADALGERRDPDVQLAYFEGLRGELADGQSGGPGAGARAPARRAVGRQRGRSPRRSRRPAARELPARLQALAAEARA